MEYSSFTIDTRNLSFTPLKGKTVMEKTMNSDLVRDALEKSYGFLTGRHGRKEDSCRHINRFLKNFGEEVCRATLQGKYTYPGDRVNAFEFLSEISEALNVRFDIEKYEVEILKELYRRFPKCIIRTNQDASECLSGISFYTCIAAKCILLNLHPDTYHKQHPKNFHAMPITK